MSGIGGIIRRFMDSGGPANKPKDPKIKTINLADYFKAGVGRPTLARKQALLKNVVVPRTINVRGCLQIFVQDNLFLKAI